ncbi:HAD family phosphatase [Candidatus Woesearchaeota archaeon]|nr:HAD family phosphatase [Candidatus Woesearchaeota archaeon]
MIKGIIFDMDGVLVDSENLKVAVWNNLLGDYGVKNGGEWYKKNIGLPRPELSRKAIEEFSLPIDVAELSGQKIKTYLQTCEKVKLIDKAFKFMKSLKDKYKLGLAASTNMIIIKKHMKEDFDYFDAVVSGEDEVPNRKPAPDIYLLAAERLELKPKECIAIEDSSTGVESAKNAGMKCIAIPNESTMDQDFSKADLVVKSLTINKIEKLNRKE